MTTKPNLASRFGARFGTPTTEDYLRGIVEQPSVQLALDIGCGVTSLLTRFRPRLLTTGLDVFTIDEASRGNAHDHYISADITDIPVERLMEKLQARFGRPRADIVTLFGVIEHFPRRIGLEILEKIERLSDRFIFVETPNGFVPQGPEYGNPYQRHLSGWFPHDFEAFGYRVHGSLGTKYMRGYMGEPRVRFPGARLLDNIVLARLLMTHRFPQHAFSITAIKDLHGVPARYASYDDPSRI